jgi:hypothetical protein
MATFEMPILGASFLPDTSGDIYQSKVSIELSMTNAKDQGCVMMEYPTGSDIGFSVSFTIPQNYAGTPVLVIKGIIDGTPANDLAFGAQQLGRDDSESVDVAYEAEDLAENGTWTGYADEDMYEETLALTPASAYVAGDTVFLWFFRDNDQDTTTFNFLLTDLMFQYSDT